MDVLREAEQTVLLEDVRAYVGRIGPIDLTNAGQVAGHLMSAETLLMRIADVFTPTDA